MSGIGGDPVAWLAIAFVGLCLAAVVAVVVGHLLQGGALGGVVGAAATPLVAGLDAWLLRRDLPNLIGDKAARAVLGPAEPNVFGGDPWGGPGDRWSFQTGALDVAHGISPTEEVAADGAYQEGRRWARAADEALERVELQWPAESERRALEYRIARDVAPQVVGEREEVPAFVDGAMSCRDGHACPAVVRGSAWGHASLAGYRWAQRALHERAQRSVAAERAGVTCPECGTGCQEHPAGRGWWCVNEDCATLDVSNWQPPMRCNGAPDDEPATDPTPPVLVLPCNRSAHLELGEDANDPTPPAMRGASLTAEDVWARDLNRPRTPLETARWLATEYRRSNDEEREPLAEALSPIVADLVMRSFAASAALQSLDTETIEGANGDSVFVGGPTADGRVHVGSRTWGGTGLAVPLTPADAKRVADLIAARAAVALSGPASAHRKLVKNWTDARDERDAWRDRARRWKAAAKEFWARAESLWGTYAEGRAALSAAGVEALDLTSGLARVLRERKEAHDALFALGSSAEKAAAVIHAANLWRAGADRGELARAVDDYRGEFERGGELPRVAVSPLGRTFGTNGSLVQTVGEKAGAGVQAAPLTGRELHAEVHAKWGWADWDELGEDSREEVNREADNLNARLGARAIAPLAGRDLPSDVSTVQTIGAKGRTVTHALLPAAPFAPNARAELCESTLRQGPADRMNATFLVGQVRERAAERWADVTCAGCAEAMVALGLVPAAHRALRDGRWLFAGWRDGRDEVSRDTGPGWYAQTLVEGEWMYFGTRQAAVAFVDAMAQGEA